MPGMNMDTLPFPPDWMPEPHDSSGTGWQPAATPANLWMKSLGAWDLTTSKADHAGQAKPNLSTG